MNEGQNVSVMDRLYRTIEDEGYVIRVAIDAVSHRLTGTIDKANQEDDNQY